MKYEIRQMGENKERKITTNKPLMIETPIEWIGSYVDGIIIITTTYPIKIERHTYTGNYWLKTRKNIKVIKNEI